MPTDSTKKEHIMIIKNLVEKSHSNSSDLVNNFLLSVYQWRYDIQESIDSNEKNWELKLIHWWLTEGREGYPNCDVSVGLSSNFMLRHVYSFQSGSSSTNFLPPFSHLVSVCIESGLAQGSKEFNEWMYRWAYPSILKSNSQFEEIFAGRMLFWAYQNEGVLISSESIVTFEQYVKTTMGIDPEESLKEYSQKFGHLVNIFGEPELEIGIGIDAKLVKKVLNEADISSEFFNNDSLCSYAPINIFATPAPSAMVYLGGLKNTLPVNLSINILSSPSEHKKWPSCNDFLLDFFDYIWLHSDFVYQSLPKNIQLKARVVPLPVEILGKSDKEASLEFFDKYQDIFSAPSYKFIVSFDLCSSIARKNPYAAIDAFKMAFGENNMDVSLIVKLNNGDLRPELAQEVFEYCESSNNIHIINERISFNELLALYEAIDCYVSLHRSEGFGRNIAEMMLLKKPVVVTGFSGNIDFNNESNSWLVPYDLVEMKTEEYLYSKDQVWADADRETASKILLDIYHSADFSEKLNNAFSTIIETYSVETCAKKYRDILEGLV